MQGTRSTLEAQTSCRSSVSSVGQFAVILTNTSQ